MTGDNLNKETEELKDNMCPICGYLLDECQCRYGGSCHPNRSKAREVVLDHLYLLNDRQLKHVINLEKSWRTSYDDNEKKQIVKNSVGKTRYKRWLRFQNIRKNSYELERRIY